MQADAVRTQRAALVERAILDRHLRRVCGVLPGTRIGRVHWPRTGAAPVGPSRMPWHYWWQAHLLDCLVDAQRRVPTGGRAATIRALVRGVWLRNLGRWTNDYYDDIAWLGLAIERATVLTARVRRHALRAITARLSVGSAPGGGVWWRRGDDYVNAPATGPAAILLARTGRVAHAAALVDWMAATLVDPATGLVRDGVRVGPDGRIREVDERIFTYCQGV
ncbi:MAG TPA: glycoside hydrolase family 76 protein, partial [Pseudonocardia sp.]|nr:glycoside hydrolase family 76 protein [Pseudonocardia sp.]